MPGTRKKVTIQKGFFEKAGGERHSKGCKITFRYKYRTRNMSYKLLCSSVILFYNWKARNSALNLCLIYINHDVRPNVRSKLSRPTA